MQPVSALNVDTQLKLSSCLSITSFTQCVEELVFNSIDANATNVFISINMSKLATKVSDDGHGIKLRDFDYITERNCSNKNNDSSLLGYRGEILASIKLMCDQLDITSRTEASWHTYRISFRQQKKSGISEVCPGLPSHGTEIVVSDLFACIPVRRKCLNKTLELEMCCRKIQAIALLHHQICFTLINDETGATLLKTRKSSLLATAMMDLLPDKYPSDWLYFSENIACNVTITGSLCPTTTSFASLNSCLQWQLVYVNRRPVHVAEISRLINEVVAHLIKADGGECCSGHSNHSAGYRKSHGVTHRVNTAAYIINISCPQHLFVTAAEGWMTVVHFHKVMPILDGIRRIITKTLARYTLSNNNCDIASDSVQSRTDFSVKCSDIANSDDSFCVRSQVNSNFVDICSSAQNKVKKRRLALEAELQSRCINRCSLLNETSKSCQSHPVDIASNATEETIKNDIKPQLICDNDIDRVSDSANHSAVKVSFTELVCADKQKCCNTVDKSNRGAAQSHVMNRKTESVLQQLRSRRITPICEMLQAVSNLTALKNKKDSTLFQQSLSRSSKSVQKCDNSCTHIQKANNLPASSAANDTIRFEASTNIYADTSDSRSLTRNLFGDVITTNRVEDTVQEIGLPNLQCTSLDCDSPPMQSSVLDYQPLDTIMSRRWKRSAVDIADHSLYNRSYLSYYMSDSPERRWFRYRREFREDESVAVSLQFVQHINRGSLLSSTDGKQQPVDNNILPDVLSTCRSAGCADCTTDVNKPHHFDAVTKHTMMKDIDEDNAITVGEYQHHHTVLHDTGIESDFSSVDGQQANSNTNVSPSWSDGDIWEEMDLSGMDENHSLTLEISQQVSWEETNETDSQSLTQVKERRPACIGQSDDDSWPVSDEDFILGLCISHFCDQADRGVLSSWCPSGVSAQSSVLTHNTATANTTTSSVKLTADMLDSFQVIGQLNREFIVGTLSVEGGTKSDRQLLAVIDQHAAHERVRLEQFTREAYSADGGTLRSDSLTTPLDITLSETDVVLLLVYRHHFSGIGVEFEAVDNSDIIKVHRVPACIISSATADIIKVLIEHELQNIRETRGGGRLLPSTLHRVLCSIACHGAIKFGDSLMLSECEQLVRQLSSCQLPFQCAHGRPSIIPLLDLGQGYMQAQQYKRPALAKLKELSVRRN